MSNQTDRKLGLDAAYRQALEQYKAGDLADWAERAGVQLDFLAEERPAAEPGGDDKRPPHRPKGSMNRTTSQFAEYFKANHRDPRLVLADWTDMPVELIAKRLQCTLLQAAQMQVVAADKLAPYVASKMPVAVSVEGSGLGTLIINAGPAPADQGGDQAPEGLVIDYQPVDEESEQNQALGDDENRDLDAGDLDE